MATWQIIATYYATGTAAGVLLGLWRPYTRARLGAIAVGSLVGTAVYTGVGLSMTGVSTSTLVMGAIIGVPMGALLGNSWWKEEHASNGEPAT